MENTKPSRARSANRGSFKEGYDPRRHIFTHEECVQGFLAAEESIARRYPGCDVHFMMCAMIGSRPMCHFLPDRTGTLADEEVFA